MMKTTRKPGEDTRRLYYGDLMQLTMDQDCLKRIEKLLKKEFKEKYTLSERIKATAPLYGITAGTIAIAGVLAWLNMRD